ncbi:type II toxin-antitoxin system RelE/ParE family toxin [Flavobacterium sp. CYK-55]|uniref:type II toxin-antitoxin system RelE/ParE family toxin n=1 Tax=Flavobacterium sp. CYK-55 TaxID=2835529 RepID=UPI001BCBD76B|nr:type II toxin-antitoxin system RelE/ParE family toxin [Flavobacterium sp. CYK-55]MBS7786179.1 type II toxin-antitoxin system RelE/ParE family toxin [Flavobacterium sp. CYK-55]
MKYRITEAAYRDLNDIWFYTFQEWSENQANQYFESIIQQIILFSENPSKAKKLAKVKSEYYYFRALSHYVFFKYGDHQIDIIRILHKMMDFPKHLE